MMRLRPLEQGDAPLMLEWMQDENVIRYLQSNFVNKNIDNCEKFIDDSQTSSSNYHFAVVDECNEYMGTVSLKNISKGSGEFAIALRTCAMGKGYTKYAMFKMIEFGFEVLRLKSIYWYVSPLNIRAIKFYDKNGFERVDGRLTQLGGVWNRVHSIFGTKLLDKSRYLALMAHQLSIIIYVYFSLFQEICQDRRKI